MLSDPCTEFKPEVVVKPTEEVEASESTPLSSSGPSKSVLFHNQEEVNAFRNRLQIKVKGENVVHPCATFHSMPIHKEVKSIIIKNIELTDWKEPTPIQMQAIPSLLAGRDVLAAAPTGSGKTAAFVIPVLSKLSSLIHQKKAAEQTEGIKALLLAPTKELAEQIYREANRLVFGKKIKICLLKRSTAATAIQKQEKSGFNKYDLLISTPLRLLSLVRAEVIDLSKVQLIVLDEADKLFELDGVAEGGAATGSGTAEAKSSNKKRKSSKEEEDSDEGSDNDSEGDEDEVDEEAAAVEAAQRIRSSFLSQVDEILSQCPDGRGVQRGLFSATIGPFVKELSESFLSNPIEISIGKENAGANTIDQRLVFVGREDGKLLAIRQIIQEGLKPPVLLFLQSVERAKELYRELIYDGINVEVIHAERTQLQREEIIRRFRVGEIWVLICTDLMARGIDFKGVQMVINYDLPQSAVSYIHRIGRTGRAGKKGTAITLFTEADMQRIRPIANVVKLSGCPVPDWMLTIKQVCRRHLIVEDIVIGALYLCRR